ncbi:MAG: hypothetical protein A3C93_01735 [Candidatus Lloydbacteria bacterium RIFCSPHIGHO2_02_FULL_54_17]|uniref:methionyl-tRNA formyltransferase n=1 Tax=Candidatus Lloydbacteria bacterium RIFCSPHIGHO2_02_FULL_54_17 TaxID=1798664 RepID=A0A1G2DCQ7_9BACT|nr:MAG: hypothetical protein A2762_03280 [Candidatus Lloydbacteria bacterium RIFCSPHIGHO2_01_FULL_54_11]OGZ11419.1 MAG: hypothetical protein A3C93_01735 [Candidatus Lloydbacteria bacterium RIFCSPHIGHO2_02_FULL_54_17]OGZ13713.1 MAG: hypothetical protein A2948_01995 [Candidatus Lloydbacteria bacterium RIFCSPLOWO2_01_FULL_54_18]OGZ15437.1 MAG: hypothetical protein A3H76_01400 [Candidatus Lloydbacteria bacterium RIFCSPLOWO2_02_FULL_54_12]
MANSAEKPRFTFFGTPNFAKIVLDELEQRGYVPALVITAPDRPKGRKLVVTPSEVRVWAESRNIPVLTPEKLRDETFLTTLKRASCDLFIVAAYGKIIPKMILDMPQHGVLNVHPSLLPLFRGPSPIESAILSDETSTGVTIILLDEETDHGPIVTQQVVRGPTLRTDAQEIQGRTLGINSSRSDLVFPEWPPKGSVLTETLAREGGILLAETLPDWVSGKVTAEPQDHARATFTKKIVKEDGAIDLAGDPSMNYKKIRAFDEWPGAYFFAERNGKKVRVRIADATYTDGKLTIIRVVPEGKREMAYDDFLRGANSTGRKTA